MAYQLGGVQLIAKNQISRLHKPDKIKLTKYNRFADLATKKQHKGTGTWLLRPHVLKINAYLQSNVSVPLKAK